MVSLENSCSIRIRGSIKTIAGNSRLSVRTPQITSAHRGFPSMRFCFVPLYSLACAYDNCVSTFTAAGDGAVASGIASAPVQPFGRADQEWTHVGGFGAGGPPPPAHKHCGNGPCRAGCGRPAETYGCECTDVLFHYIGRAVRHQLRDNRAYQHRSSVTFILCSDH